MEEKKNSVEYLSMFFYRYLIFQAWQLCITIFSYEYYAYLIRFIYL